MEQGPPDLAMGPECSKGSTRRMAYVCNPIVRTVGLRGRAETDLEPV